MADQPTVEPGPGRGRGRGGRGGRGGGRGGRGGRGGGMLGARAGIFAGETIDQMEHDLVVGKELANGGGAGGGDGGRGGRGRGRGIGRGGRGGGMLAGETTEQNEHQDHAAGRAHRGRGHGGRARVHQVPAGEEVVITHPPVSGNGVRRLGDPTRDMHYDSSTYPLAGVALVAGAAMCAYKRAAVNKKSKEQQVSLKYNAS